MKRKLASIQEITSIEPLEGADFIELVSILGWKCIAKKGEFDIGDKCVYFEVDSYLPTDDERFEFLRKSSYRKNELLGEGFRIRTMKMRGHYSQGVALPLDDFPELDGLDIGSDVTETLRVKKWELPETVGNMGTTCGQRPDGVPKTDETRVQTLDALRERLLGKPYYISTKMDGTSMSVWYLDGEVGVSGRNQKMKDDGTSPMWTVVHNLGLDDALRKLGKNIVIQGEFCGPGIQKNRLQLKEPHFYVFNIFIDKHLVPLDEMLALCDELEIEHVPIEETGNSFDYSFDDLLIRGEGKYPSGQQKEGIVVRPQTPFWDKDLEKSLSFKVLNNKFLLKE